VGGIDGLLLFFGELSVARENPIDHSLLDMQRCLYVCSFLDVKRGSKHKEEKITRSH
jgi:hypothetical protein